jgi:Lon protease-like protein
MSEIGDSSFVPEQFSGVARLFPLPNLVVFPHVMQPLHIFEPRYRQLVEQAMADDRLIAMAVLAPGWEKDYDGRPPVNSVACLSRITNCQKLGDGRFNIMVLGLRRIELVRELPPKHLFREAQSRLLSDEYPPAAAASRPGLQRDLVEAFRKVLPALVSSHEQLQELLVSDIPLGMLTDIISYTLDLDLQFKQKLLAEPMVDLRASLLLSHLGSLPLEPARPAFPPDFSAN